MFHPPGKFPQGIVHAINLRMGGIQTAAKRKVPVSISIGQAENPRIGKGKQCLTLAVCKINLCFIHKKSPLNGNSRLFWAAWLLAVLHLLSGPQQFFVVILSCPRRVNADPDMLKTRILTEHGFDSSGIFKSA